MTNKHQVPIPSHRAKHSHPGAMENTTTRVRSVRAEILLQNPSALELGSSVRRSLNMKAAEQFDQLKRRYPGARFLRRDKRELWLGFVRMQLIQIASYNDGGLRSRHGGSAIGAAMTDVWSYIVKDFNKGINSAMRKVLQGVELKEALEKLLDSSAKAIDGYARVQPCPRPGMRSKEAPSEGSAEVSIVFGGVRGSNNLEILDPNSFADKLRKEAGYDSDDSARSNGPRAGDPLLKKGDRNRLFCPKRIKVRSPSFQPNLRSHQLGLATVAQNPGVSARQQLAPAQSTSPKQDTSDSMRTTALEVRELMPAFLGPTNWRNERPLSGYDYATRMNLHISRGGHFGNSSSGGHSFFRQGPTFHPSQITSSSEFQPLGRVVPSELISGHAVMRSTAEQPRMYSTPGIDSPAIGVPYAPPFGERGHYSYSAEDVAINGGSIRPEYSALRDPGDLYYRGF